MDELLALIQVMGRLERICRDYEQQITQLKAQIVAPEPGVPDA